MSATQTLPTGGDPIPDTVERTTDVRAAAAATWGVVTLHAVTLAAAYSRTDPYPPLALVPFIAATAALGVTAALLLPTGGRTAWLTAGTFSVVSMVSFGPQKLFLGDMPDIAPAVVVGFALECLVLVLSIRHTRRPTR